jgi:DNA-directed RNA polymerase subunit RPC12/RpoP
MQAVSLKCSSCGASLSIPSDINHLACGFCGTEQVVVRDGGIVALKSVTDAIDRVKQSTDKTAAELALKRLREELNALVRHRDERRRYWQGQLDPKRNQLANMPSRYNNVWGTGLGSFVLCPAITIIIALQLFPGY